jgi:hypothetical protein
LIAVIIGGIEARPQSVREDCDHLTAKASSWDYDHSSSGVAAFLITYRSLSAARRLMEARLAEMGAWNVTSVPVATSTAATRKMTPMRRHYRDMITTKSLISQSLRRAAAPLAIAPGRRRRSVRFLRHFKSPVHLSF